MVNQQDSIKIEIPQTDSISEQIERLTEQLIVSLKIPPTVLGIQQDDELERKFMIW